MLPAKDRGESDSEPWRTPSTPNLMTCTSVLAALGAMATAVEVPILASMTLSIDLNLRIRKSGLAEFMFNPKRHSLQTLSRCRTSTGHNLLTGSRSPERPMQLARRALFESPLLRIGRVTARPTSTQCGAVEAQSWNAVVLPLTGVFAKHKGRAGMSSRRRTTPSSSPPRARTASAFRVPSGTNA